MKKEDSNIFKYNKVLKPICGLFTKHNRRRILGWSDNIDYNNLSKSDYYYKCKVCGYVYFNNNPSKEDIEFIRSYEDDKTRESRYCNNSDI